MLTELQARAFLRVFLQQLRDVGDAMGESFPRTREEALLEMAIETLTADPDSDGG